jgi:uncharacterized repeat protein (TIGR01451 family)
VVLPDPAPSGVDGEDLTVDAGVVVGETPTEQPAPQPTSPGPPPPQPEGEILPATQEQRARLTIAKRADRRTVRAGGSVSYRIVVRNTGNATARNTVVCDSPGRGLSVRRTPRGATFRDGRLCWRVGTLAAGAARTLRVTMQTERTLRRETVTNVVRVTADGVRSERVSATVRVLRRQAAAVGRPGVTG